jgi:HK97 family phage prohead protease
MSDGLCFRAVDSELKVVGDGRTIVGLLAPYNAVSLVNDGFGPYYESFAPGCFERCIKGNASYLRLQLEHNGHWVGRGHAWRDGPSGLGAELRLDDTEAGREAAFKVRDGQTPGLSLAFRPSPSDKEVEREGRRVLVRAKVRALHHVALCQTPAYKDAQVLSIRSAPEGPPVRLQYWKDWTDALRRG